MHPKRTAWKNGTADSSIYNIGKILRKECAFGSLRQFMACLNRKLYHKKDEFSLTGSVGRREMSWKLRYSGAFFGMCYTGHYSEPIGTDMREDAVVIKFNQMLSYFVFIHDPNFFLPTLNPSTFPRKLPNIF